jgi:Raf kinase inhibitor-like YbhB/YbcL family protein
MATAISKTLTIKSPAFEHNGFIPSKYTCEGIEISPALNVMDIPEGTRSLALIVDDPNAPTGTFVHWVMWNIPPLQGIEENSAPGTVGKNGRMENRYMAPCPPTGTHNYHFKVYALDTELDLNDNTDKAKLEKAMEGHVIASGELIGKYQKGK